MAATEAPRIIVWGQTLGYEVATGTTTNSYVYVLEWDVRCFDKVFLVVDNTGGSNSISYQTEGASDSAFTRVAVMDADNSLAHSTVESLQMLRGSALSVEPLIFPYIRIGVKSTVGGSHSTYSAALYGYLK